MKRTILLYLLTLLAVAVSAQADRQYIRSGNKFFRQQNFAKAEVEYRKAVSENSGNAQAIYNLGCALMMQNKDSAAVEQFQRAGQLETSKLRKAKSYHNIGVICQTKKMYAEAINAYKEGLRNNPSDNETRYNLALCKRLQKNDPRNNQNKNQDKNKQNKDKDKQNKDKQNQDKNKQQKNKQQQDKERMSKDNAEQLLNAAMQDEKNTQQRVKDAMHRSRPRKLDKNW